MRPPPRPDVSLEIDRLVIDGADPTGPSPTALKRAVERELSALMASGDLTGVGEANLERVSARPVGVNGPSGTTGLARGVAAAIHAAIGGAQGAE